VAVALAAGGGRCWGGRRCWGCCGPRRAAARRPRWGCLLVALAPLLALGPGT
jgi:hypothetical protein